MTSTVLGGTPLTTCHTHPPRVACHPPQGQLWLGVLMGLVYYLASVSVFWAVYEEIPHAPHPYLTGLSVVGGVTAFPPAWHGALVGPLLLVTMSLIFNLYRSFLAKGRKTHQSVHKMRRQVDTLPLSSLGRLSPVVRREKGKHGTFDCSAVRRSGQCEQETTGI